MKIKNFAEGAEHLVAKLSTEVELDSTWQVVSLGDLAIPIAVRIAQELATSTVIVNVSRGKDLNGFLNEPEFVIPENLGKKLLVCDVGVETGKTATQFVGALKASGFQCHLWLVALVIPKEIESLLRQDYQKLISIKSPLVRRELRWEFDEFA
ncbi:MAG: phosphoribosyltransferase [Actinobacteria bacterium]|nr:phosphoribosyltransferase [Actinomycetota bacterium]